MPRKTPKRDLGPSYRRWHVKSTPSVIERQRQIKAGIKGAPPKMGASVTRYPDPGGNPGLYVSADDVAVRAGGLPMRNPTAGAGQGTAAAIGTVIATTGALPAGTYYVECSMGFSAIAAAGKHIQLEHRNAADSATVNLLGLCPGGAVFGRVFQRIVIAANERIRAIIGPVAGGAGEVAHAEIRVYRLDV